MLQTLIKVGNSLAVTVPKSFIRSLKLRAGQKVFVDADESLDLMQVKTQTGQFTGLTPEFKEWLDGISKKYKRVIRELARQ